MQPKIGRFNYLPNSQGEARANEDSNRLGYEQIITQLTKEHHHKQEEPILHQYPSKRWNSPVGPLFQLNLDPNNRHIKSILLNEPILPNKHQESTEKNKDIYKIIKDSHVVSDEELISFYEPRYTPTQTKTYSPSPLKEIAKQQEKQEPITNFYRVTQQPIIKTSRKMFPKGNRPYLLHTPNTYRTPYKERKEINPESRKMMTPPRTSEISGSRTTKCNGAYKDKSQERVYEPVPIQTYQHRHQPQVNPVWKRSCYDYIPEEMRNKFKSHKGAF